MRRVALVVQRCGLEVNGGSEKHCLDVARRLAESTDVEILTTCALEYQTWEDHYPPGLSEIDGVAVRRFRVAEPRDPEAFERRSQAIRLRGAAVSIPEAERWMRAQGPWSPDLITYLREHGRDYEACFFFTYLYATAYYGLPEVEDRAFLVPTAHDEWPLKLPIWDRFFARPRAFLFNTVEERAMLRRRFPALPLPGSVVGLGVEAPAQVDPEAFCRRYDVPPGFLLYIGRIEPAKGCDLLFDHYARWRGTRIDAPPLVLIGRAFMDVPRLPGVVHAGFVDDQSKWDALAACQALCMPSPYESLSIALLEAWHAGKPVLVNEACDVLVGQTRRAQGGVWFRDAAEFGVALDRLRDPVVGSMLGRQGRRFVEEQVSWDRVIDAYRERIEEAVAARRPYAVAPQRAF